MSSQHLGDRGTEAGKSLSSRLDWFTEIVLGQPGLPRESLSWEKRKRNKEGGEEGRRKGERK